MITSHNTSGEWEDYIVTSHTSPDKEYLVTVDNEEETVYCTCPHFIYRLQTEKWGGAKLTDVDHHCKHIMEVLGNGEN